MKSTIRKACSLILLGFMIVVLQACGSDKQGENTKLGMTAVEQLKYDEALTYFAAATEAEENPVYVQRGLGLAYMGKTDYETALLCFQAALDNGGTKPADVDYDINYYMAVCYYKLGQYENALDRYNAIIALRSKEVDAYMQRGIVLLKLNKHDEALADFNMALSLAKSDYGLYVDIYSALKDNGYEAEGMEYLNIAMEEGGEKMSSYDKGRIYFYQENYTYARDYLEKARSQGNKTEEVLLLLGQSYEALNDRAYALTLYGEYVAENPSAAIYNQMGLCYAATGDYENALDSFEKGLSVEGNACRQELLFNRIVAYENLGDFETAKKYMKEYLKAYPDDERAQRENEFLQTR